MTRAARLAGLALALAVLAFSGIYVVVYLARWQWNRALMSGFVFLSMLVILTTVLILRRLREISESLKQPGEAPVRAALREASADAATGQFDWLRPDRGTTSVFIPVLLGAGMLLSGAAYVIERVSGRLAGSTLDRRTAQLIPVDLPLGGGEPVSPEIDLSRREAHRRRTTLVTALAVIVVLGTGTEALRRLTQTATGSLTSAGTTSITVEVQTRRGLSADQAAVSLWTTCGDRLGRRPDLVEMTVQETSQSAATVHLVVARALGHTARRRVVGCLEDFTVEYALADVVALTTDPSDE